MISIISPVYVGENVIGELVLRLQKTLTAISPEYEIILVDDNSPDNSWKIISELCSANNQIKGIRLQNNCGQHAAIHAGLSNAKGDLIIVMDCDLQDPPEEIPNIYSVKENNHCDAVVALRNKSWQSSAKRFYSQLFYFTLSALSRTKLKSNNANFGIYDRELIDRVLLSSSNYFFFPLAIAKNAEAICYVDSEFKPDIPQRKSSYSLSKALRLALIILRSNTIFASSRLRKQQEYVISEIKGDR